MSLINQKTAGFLLPLGWLIGLLAGIFFQVEILTVVVFIFAWFLLVVFLFNPLAGVSIFLILRPSLDKISHHYSLRFTENFSLNISSFLGIFIIFLTLLFFLKNYQMFFRIPLRYPAMIFWFLVVFSIFYSLDRFLSLYEAIRILSIFSIFFLIFTLSRYQKNAASFLLKVIMISAFLPMLVAFWQLFTQSGLGGTGGLESRLYGTFAHPNSFASFLIIIWGLSFYFLSVRSRKEKDFWWALALFGATGFLLLETYSRGAWLGVLAFLFFYGILRSPKIIVLGAVALVLLFLTVPSFHDRVEDAYNPPADSSIVWRFQKWQRVLAAIKKHPFIGSGAGTETMVHEREYGFYAGNPYTHNDFLKIWLENGLIGLTTYLNLIFLIWFYLAKQYWRSQNKTAQSLVLIVGLIFLSELVFSMSSNIWRGTATMWVVWALIALALSLSQSRFEKKSQ